jgi:DNA adenine methylase
MKYMGSKSRIKKNIVPILQKIIDDNEIKTYVEPFVGGANIIDAIKCERRIGGDTHEYLIALLKHVRDGGELPIEISKELYDDVRKNKNTKKYEDWYVGAVGFLASFNGRYFDGGYAKPIVKKTGKIRSFYDEAKRNIEKQSSNLKGIEFLFCDYRYFSDFENCLIYCDIPYKNTKQFSTSKNFNHNIFWEWARQMSKKNIVIISESQAPDDFECIWEQEVSRTINTNNGNKKKSTEKYFISRGDGNDE